MADSLCSDNPIVSLLKTISMARSKNNIATEGLSGKISQLVFRQRYGKTVVAKRPVMSGVITAAQESVRNLFRQGAIYARSVLNNPLMFAFYKSKTRVGQTPYNLALADYCKAPEIGEINSSGYNGGVGQPLSVVVTDNGRVESVKLKIENGNGMVEEGDATPGMDGLTWHYASHVVNGSLAGTRITVTATDLAGRVSSKQFNL